MAKKINLEAEAKKALKANGAVEYIFKGMTKPADYAGTAAPYASEADYASARELAEAKLEYLLKTSDASNISDPNSFIDLRDGGTDLQGIAGKPIMTGWLTLADELLNNTTLLDGLQKAGKKIAKDFAGFLVIGIGGSYTDVDGIISACKPYGTPIPVRFLGQHLSSEAYKNVFAELNALKGPIAVNIISKSGTTTEPAIAARLALKYLKNVGAVFATTDPVKGALREMTKIKGYNPEAYLPKDVQKDFFIGENVGGRFSALTPVGLLPFAVAGINLRELILGYYHAMHNMLETAIEATAYKYAAYKNGATTKLLAYNVPALRGKLLGFRQLWPECNGKAGKGLNVMEEFYTADAHSNGQLIRSGIRNIQEIFHFVGDIGADFDIPSSKIDLDKLGGIAQGSKGALSLHEINNYFMSALLLDHWKSGVPVMTVKLPSLSPFAIGAMTGIEHVSATLFGLMDGIDPVNQPGVQGYKEVAFSLLGMKGPEEKKSILNALKELGL